MKKYNVIGDLHGKDPLKYFDKEYINIFVGDYFDPYDNTPFDTMQENFLKLMDLKRDYPNNTILLYGNHDFHYIIEGLEKYSRYSKWNAGRILELFNEFEDYFSGVAYNAGGKLVTHAGVSKIWLRTRGIDDYKSLDDLVESINNLWWDKERRFYSFSFEYNGEVFDTYGTSQQQSPLWVRAQTLVELPTEFSQIVGHTQFKDIVRHFDYTFVDCLNYSGNTYKFEIEE